MADAIYAGDAGIFKTCTKCNETKPLGLFSKTKQHKSGLRSFCKRCAADYCASRPFRKNINKIGVPFVCRGCGVDGTTSAAIQFYCSVCSVKNSSRGFKPKRSPNICVECSTSFEACRVTVERCVPCRKKHHLANLRRLMKDKRSDEAYAEKEKAARLNDDARGLRRITQKRHRSKPQQKFENAIKAGFRRGLKQGSKGGRTTFSLLGYTADELREHLERQFLSGMTWDNHGEWHVDHIVPLSAHNYDTPDDFDFKRAWALDNLQPLWAVDNLQKNSRILSSFQPSLKIQVPLNAVA